MTKQYFNKLDTKRYNEFRKVELSVVADAAKVEKELEKEMKEFNSTFVELEDKNEVLSMLRQDLSDELQLIKKQKDRFGKVIDEMLTLRGLFSTDFGLLEDKIVFAEDAMNKIKNAAKDLGVKPVDIPVYVELFERVRIASGNLKSSENLFKMAEKNIQNATKVQKQLNNI
tara:strand:+ start:224 stop:736 length:513 start_codon:yes stop_codon:yes gene_type:complete